MSFPVLFCFISQMFFYFKDFFVVVYFLFSYSASKDQQILMLSFKIYFKEWVWKSHSSLLAQRKLRTWNFGLRWIFYYFKPRQMYFFFKDYSTVIVTSMFMCLFGEKGYVTSHAIHIFNSILAEIKAFPIVSNTEWTENSTFCFWVNKWCLSVKWWKIDNVRTAS